MKTNKLIFLMKNQELENLFLHDNIFYGLNNVNDESECISEFYFSELDFEVMLKRVQKHRLGIKIIEPFVESGFYIVDYCELHGSASTDPKWYWKSFDKIKKVAKNAKLELSYKATFYIPSEKLNRYFACLN